MTRGVRTLAGALLLLAASYGVARHLAQRQARELRMEPARGLTAAAAGQRLRDLGLFDAHRNPEGRGLPHDYELRSGGTVVFDRSTGLYWQRAGSAGRLRFDEAQTYVARLNAAAFGGHADWRLPTLEEAMSLVEPRRQAGGLYLDPVFGPEQWWIWTADREGAVGVWVVYFYGGGCLVHLPLGGSTFVRAVRRPAAGARGA